MVSTDKITDRITGGGDDGPGDRLRGEVQNLLGAVGHRALGSVRDKVGGMTERLTDFTEQGGGSSLVGAVTGARDMAEGKSPARSLLGAGAASLKDKVKNLFGGGKGGGGKKLKVTNIVEAIDVGVPVRVAYNQWTQFADFPSFMKKVENVDQNEDEKLSWKAQVWWSHRTWESTIQSQKPDDHIVWKSKGAKGHVDGSVTFHELAPNLTRILLNMEYHPQGLFERTGNLWRAQGRRARLELKHFHRHVMNNTILNPDEVEGWRGVIEDGEVVKDHETAAREEQEAQQESGQDVRDEEPEDEERDQAQGPDEGEPGRTEDEAPEDEAPEDEAPEDEAPEDEAPEDEAPEDEAPEDEAPGEEEEEPADEAESEEEPDEEEREPSSSREGAGSARRGRVRRSPEGDGAREGRPVRRRTAQDRPRARRASSGRTASQDE